MRPRSDQRSPDHNSDANNSNAGNSPAGGEGGGQVPGQSPGGSSATANRFEVGQLVQHRRYAYRGAVIAVDLRCTDDDDWYLSNQTQPDREQPWYHVLVHGKAHTTYVAQSNLEEDHGGEQVIHPLARQFFEYFHRGRYQPR